MMDRKLTIRLSDLALIVILATNCSLWLLEYILDMHIAVALIVAAAIGLQFLKKKIRLVRGSAVLLLFILGIMLSIAVNGATTRVLYRMALFGLLLIYANIADADPDTLETGRRFVVGMGLFTAAMVMVQFVLKGTFTYPYFSLLAEAEKTEALFYYNSGYYAGLNIKPHETAGIISMTLAAMLIAGQQSGKPVKMLMPLVLLVPMLLTGKRAISVLTVVALFLVLMLALIVQKRWGRIIGIIVAAGAAVALMVWYISTHPNNPLFTRFMLMFSSDGSFIDNTRLRLWMDAWNLWKENKLFGVGWWQFNDLTTSLLNYSKGHSVNLDYLQFLCETGIVGFVLMMTPIVCMLYRAIRLESYAVKHMEAGAEKNQVLFAVYVQFFILMYALIEVPFYNNCFFVFYVFSCLIINVYYWKYHLPSNKRKKIRLIHGA